MSKSSEQETNCDATIYPILGSSPVFPCYVWHAEAEQWERCQSPLHLLSHDTHWCRIKPGRAPKGSDNLNTTN